MKNNTQKRVLIFFCCLNLEFLDYKITCLSKMILLYAMTLQSCSAVLRERDNIFTCELGLNDWSSCSALKSPWFVFLKWTEIHFFFFLSLPQKLRLLTASEFNALWPSQSTIPAVLTPLPSRLMTGLRLTIAGCRVSTCFFNWIAFLIYRIFKFR